MSMLNWEALRCVLFNFVTDAHSRQKQGQKAKNVDELTAGLAIRMVVFVAGHRQPKVKLDYKIRVNHQPGR